MSPNHLEEPVKQYDLIEIREDIKYIKRRISEEDKGKTWFNRTVIVALLMSLGQAAALIIFYWLFRKSP